MHQQLFEVSFLFTLVMLAAMFASVLFPMLVLPLIAPQLSTDAHEKTRWLDGLRGIAAATVALNHAPLMIICLQLVSKVFVFSKHSFVLFSFFGSIGVQIFFCITGMLFAEKVLFAKQFDSTEFFRKRIYRITPAYFTACVLALLVAAWYSWPIKQPISEILVALPKLFSFGLIPLPTKNGLNFSGLLGVNWTLGIEWKFYVMLPILFVLIRDFRRVAVITIVAFVAWDLVSRGNSSAWVFFISGAICAPLLYRQLGTPIRVLGHIGLFLVLMLFVGYWSEFPNYGYQRWMLMTALFVSVVVARPWILTTRPIVAMGSVSYSFYLLHYMTLFAVLGGCHIYLFDITTMSLTHFTMLAGFALSFATVLSTISYLFVERRFIRGRRLTKSHG